jgi:hypothetical protein
MVVLVKAVVQYLQIMLRNVIASFSANWSSIEVLALRSLQTVENNPQLVGQHVQIHESTSRGHEPVFAVLVRYTSVWSKMLPVWR